MKGGDGTARRRDAARGIAGPGTCRHPTGTFTPFGFEAIEQTLAERWQAQVSRFPEHVALRANGKSVTYAELDAQANRIARAIHARRGPGEEPIAACLAKGPTAVASLLGILKVGKIYVMLDPSYGAARLGAIAADTRAPLIICDGPHAALADALTGPGRSVLRLDAMPIDTAPGDAVRPSRPERPALISYTSGSSGEPKGVIDTHRNVLYHVMAFTNALGICPDDRLTLLHSLSVRAAEMHALGALLNGATLCPFDVAAAGATALGEWLRDERITLYHSLPTIFREMVAAAGRPLWPDLRVVQLSSAPVTPRDVELCRAHTAPHCVFMHRIGSTEAQTIRFHLLARDAPLADATVPLGHQVAETEVLIWDEEGRTQPAGTTGEIVIKSRYLSPGYWNRPELSERAFATAPDGSGARLYRTGDLGRLSADGCLELVGRRDAQVKVRGQKVDPGAIEIALLGIPGVRQAAVVARDDAAGPGAVIAYLALAGTASVSGVRRALRHELPSYMVPTRFVVLDKLPHTANGKIDRPALPAPDDRRPPLDMPFVSPGTPLEATLAEIWQESLGLAPLGVNDPFLDLGGDSLIAMRIVRTVCARLGLDLPVTVLLEAPTIAEMAALAVSALSSRRGPDAVERFLGRWSPP